MTACSPIARRSLALAALALAAGALALSWAPGPAFAADRMVLGESFMNTG